MIICKNCKSENQTSSHCTVCSYPIQGSEQEQATFIARQVTQKSDVEESWKRLKTARKILFGIGVFYLVISFTPLMPDEAVIALVLNLLLAAMFIGFALLTYKNPLVAMGVPLVLILVYYLGMLFIDPVYLWTGIFWKVLVVTGLTYGFVSVRKSNRILRENTYLASILEK